MSTVFISFSLLFPVYFLHVSLPTLLHINEFFSFNYSVAYICMRYTHNICMDLVFSKTTCLDLLSMHAANLRKITILHFKR